MRINWIGHSCFAVESGGYTVILDPYQAGSVPGIAPVKACAHKVLCSHGHFDHGAAEEVTLLPERECPFTVRTLCSFHDEAQGSKRGKNLIHLLTAEGMTLVHLGDLGHMPEEETLAEMKGADVLLIPVGGFYTIDGDTAALLTQQVQPRVVIPMHYRSEHFGFEVLTGADVFLQHMDNVTAPGTCMEVTKDTPACTAHLTPERMEQA